MCAYSGFFSCYTKKKFKAVYKISYFVPSIFNYFQKEAVFLWLEMVNRVHNNKQGLITSCTSPSLTEQQQKCIPMTLNPAKP